MKDVYQLNKDAWYAKLLKYVYDIDYHDFSHFCPFFWVLLITLIASPLLLPIIFIWKQVAIFFKNLADESRNEFESWASIYLHDIQVNPASFEALKKVNFWKKGTRLYKFVFDYCYYQDPQIYLELEGIYLESLYSKNNKVENKNKINKIVKYTKPIGVFIVYALFAVIAYVLLIGLIELTKYLMLLPPATWMEALKYLLITFIVTILVIGIVYLNKKFKYSSENKTFDKIGNFITYPFIKFGEGFVKVFNFIKMLYNEYCPAIKWN